MVGWHSRLKGRGSRLGERRLWYIFMVGSRPRGLDTKMGVYSLCYDQSCWQAGVNSLEGLFEIATSGSRFLFRDTFILEICPLSIV